MNSRDKIRKENRDPCQDPWDFGVCFPVFWAFLGINVWEIWEFGFRGWGKGKIWETGGKSGIFWDEKEEKGAGGGFRWGNLGILGFPSPLSPFPFSRILDPCGITDPRELIP